MLTEVQDCNPTGYSSNSAMAPARSILDAAVPPSARNWALGADTATPTQRGCQGPSLWGSGGLWGMACTPPSSARASGTGDAGTIFSNNGGLSPGSNMHLPAFARQASIQGGASVAALMQQGSHSGDWADLPAMGSITAVANGAANGLSSAPSAIAATNNGAGPVAGHAKETAGLPRLPSQPGSLTRLGSGQLGGVGVASSSGSRPRHKRGLSSCAGNWSYAHPLPHYALFSTLLHGGDFLTDEGMHCMPLLVLQPC